MIEEPDINSFAVKLVAAGERLALMGSRFLPPERIRRLAEALGCEARVERKDRFVAWVVADKRRLPVRAPAGSGRGAAADID